MVDAARWDESAMPALDGRVAIVTGANSGLGLATARTLASKNARVVLACRDGERARQAAAAIRRELPCADVATMELDLADLDAVRAFAGAFGERFDRLDLLINNAGVMMPPKSRTAQGFELQLGVNHLGHSDLTSLLMGRLAETPGARVVTVASQAHRQGHIDFDDLDWEERPYDRSASYAQSKLANLLFTRELARRVAAAGLDVKAVAAHPGWTETDLSRHFRLGRAIGRVLNPLIAMQPRQGALPTLRAAVDPGASSGDYFGPHGLLEIRGYPVRVEPAAAARDADVARRLWDVSAQRCGVDHGVRVRG